MVHLTLNSGKIRRRKTPDSLPQYEESVRSFLDKGGGVLPFPYHTYRTETDVTETGVAFHFFSGDDVTSLFQAKRCVGLGKC
jgi:hypothetical protein